MEDIKQFHLDSTEAETSAFSKLFLLWRNLERHLAFTKETNKQSKKELQNEEKIVLTVLSRNTIDGVIVNKCL